MLLRAGNKLLPHRKHACSRIDRRGACGYDSGMERQLSSNARISRRLRGLLATLAVLAAAGVLAVAGINIYVVGSARDRILTVEQAAALDADCILVLGAGLQDDGSPSAILADRLDCALALYERGASDRLLMSGDHSRVDYKSHFLRVY